MRKALVIEDDDDIRANLQDLLQEEGFEVLTSVDGRQGISLATRHRPSVIICDILLPEVDGYTVLGAVRADPDICTVPFLFLTAKAEKNDIRVGMNLGADDYVTKPFSNSDLIAAVRTRIERAEKLRAARRREEAEPPASTPTAKPVVHDPGMRAVYDQVDKVAPEDDLGILLLGENGVGKEVIARAIHARSRRAERTFVAFNCAALPETLLEGELFGHEKGAFTGAAHDKKGLFETAEGGTVFLDEIGELPTSIQVKLLRVLQEKEVMRVGARAPTRLDVRFLAATNRDLETAIEDGSFRQDLYYRFPFPIHIPPLRERTAEIVPLAETFAAEACRVSGRAVPKLSTAAIDLLKTHAWPGNVRELKNAVQRALVLCGPGPIEPEHLGLRQPRARMQTDPTLGAISSRDTLRAQQGAMEKQLYVDALKKFAGNQTKAAAYIGVSRRTFVTKMDEFGLDRPRKG